MGATSSSSRNKKILDAAKKELGYTPNQHLCVYCQNIFRLWDDVHSADDYSMVRFPHYQDISAFKHSAENGCYLCSLFVKHDKEFLEHFVDGVARELKRGYRCNGLFAIVSQSFLPNKFGDEYRGFELSPHWRLELSCGFIDSKNAMMSRSFLNVEVCHDDDSSIISTMITPGSRDQLRASIKDSKSVPGGFDSINTRQSLAHLSQWLEQCCNSHKECRNPATQVSPTRLIHLASGGPRLCLSTEFESCPRYATLSHCWGPTKFPTLDRTNLQAFRKEIPSSALQKTFKDAIAISKHVGIHYLWIDSLCIIQGDEEDWNREAPLMCDVYGGSSLNIAASGASDGTKGCFVDRDGHLPGAFKVQAMVDKEWRLFSCSLTDLYLERLDKMPLLRRSWAFQERLLAPRTVHFTTTEMFWECNELVACETFPRGYPVSLRYGDSFWTKQPVTRSMWPWIVRQYSFTELTYRKDKLAAISGTAQHIQLETGDTYTFGLWSRGLEDQLCWHSYGNKLERNGRAPSWSWASVDGSITWNNLQAGSVHIRVLQLPNTLLGRNSRPEISSGKLVLSSGYLFATSIPKSHHQGVMTAMGHTIGYMRKVSNSELFLDLDCPSASNLDESHEICFLPCRSYIEEKEESDPVLPRVMVKGLLIVRALQSDSAFQRIGVFEWLSLIHPMQPTPEQTIELFHNSLHDQGYRPRVLHYDKSWNGNVDEVDSSSAQRFTIEIV